MTAWVSGSKARATTTSALAVSRISAMSTLVPIVSSSRSAFSFRSPMV